MTSAEFLATCDRMLDATDTRDIHGLLDNYSDFVVMAREAGNTQDRFGWVKAACVHQWRAREIQIRNAIVRLRAAKISVDAKPFLRPCREMDCYIEKAVAEAMGRPQPLERELGLDQLRWSLLDDLSRFDPFGLPAVVAYGLKLKLVERWEALTVAKGRAAVEGYLTKQRVGMVV